MPRPLRVFLCHSSKDKPAVRELYKRLSAETWIDPWLDEEKLFPGQDWHEEIEKAVEATDVVVVLLSKQSVSQEGYVQRELKLALDVADEKPENTIFIIPLRLDDCPAPRRLRGWHYVDYFPANRKDWVLDRLIASLKLRAKALGIENTTNDVENRKSDDAEQAKIARLAQEAKERSEREAAEKIAREKLEAVRKAAFEREKRETKRKKQRQFITVNSRWIGIGGIVLIALFFGGFGLNYLIKNLPIATIPSTNNASTFDVVTSTIVFFTSTPQPIDTLAPTPTLGIGSTMISEKDGMMMIYVPEDNYLDAFYIDQSEVTNAMYAKCVDAGQCKSPTKTFSHTRSNYFGSSEFADYPVIYIDWNMASSYCGWADRRLPTQGEWYKAAYGSDGRTFPWGDEDLSCDKANYQIDCVGDTTKVLSYPDGVSPYGVYDMAGNVWEWVSNKYSNSYYPSLPALNSSLVNGPYGLLFGGSWNYNYYVIRDKTPFRADLLLVGNYLGFRCSRDVSP